MFPLSASGISTSLLAEIPLAEIPLAEIPLAEIPPPVEKYLYMESLFEITETFLNKTINFRIILLILLILQ